MLIQNINSQFKNLLSFTLLILLIIITTKFFLEKKNNKFILTEFYYPSISNFKNNSPIRNVYNLKPEIDTIKNGLRKNLNINEFNIVDHLNRSNYFYFIFKNDEIDLIQNLSSQEIKYFMLDFELAKYDDYIKNLQEFIMNKNYQLTFHLKKMYSKKITWKSEKFIKKFKIQEKEFQKFNLEKLKKKFESEDCQILKNINFIKVSCNFFPIDLLEQNIEINFYY